MRARNVDVNGLERELAEFRDIIDGWINENVARERRLKDAHERNLHRLEREYEGLIERERNLSERAAENQAEAERYELEAEQALEEANAARELADGLPEQLALLREQVRLERMSIDRAQEKVTSASAMAKLDALRHASATYAERLGLRFEYGDAEKLRLAFKYVDAAAPEREFVLGVRLRGSAYEVVECAPRLENIDALVDECNRTNDFGKFVRDARRGFVAEANGETRDARAPPKKGIDVDRFGRERGGTTTTTTLLARATRARAVSSRRRADQSSSRARARASSTTSSSSSPVAFRAETKTFARLDDDDGAPASTSSRDGPASTSSRDAVVRALLVLDDRAHEQLGVTVEGRRVRDEVRASDVAARLRALSSALPRSCSPRVFEIVVERPGLLTLDADACGRAVERCGDALGGADALERLCEDCAPAFAHVLWRLGCLETTFDEMERPLKEWVRGEEGWHRVFVQRIASEWGYLRMMKRMNTSIYAGEGVVYRNAKTGESIAFQRSQSIVDRHGASDP